MEMQEMEITIDNEGRVYVKVNGAHGTDCLAITQDLEKNLGIVEQREYSADYFRPQVHQKEHHHL